MSSFWHNQRVCVTGGGGFLGFHLVKLLREQGARVRVLCLPPSDDHPLRQMPDVETHFGDLLDEALTRRALADCDVVFHTAAIVATWGAGLQRMDDVNVRGTQIVLNAAPGRVVHTSSVVAVGASRHREVLNEQSDFNLDAIGVDYVRTKRAAEELAQSRPDTIAVNPGFLLGPNDHEGSTMTRAFRRYWRGRMPALPPGGHSLADVRDVARGHLLAAEKGVCGRRYILAGENLDWAALAERLAAVAGFRPRWTPTLPAWSMRVLASLAERRAAVAGREPYPSIQHARMQRYFWYYDSARARGELGYRTRPLDETLQDMYRSLQDQHAIKLKGLNRWLLRPAA